MTDLDNPGTSFLSSRPTYQLNGIAYLQKVRAYKPYSSLTGIRICSGSTCRNIFQSHQVQDEGLFAV